MPQDTHRITLSTELLWHATASMAGIIGAGSECTLDAVLTLRLLDACERCGIFRSRRGLWRSEAERLLATADAIEAEGTGMSEYSDDPRPTCETCQGWEPLTATGRRWGTCGHEAALCCGHEVHAATWCHHHTQATPPNEEQS